MVGQVWGEPWEGTHAGLLEGLPTGLRSVEWPGGRWLAVPGPGAAQRHPRAAIPRVDTPPRACRGQAHTARGGAHEARPLTALCLPHTRAGVGLAPGPCHRPAVAGRAPDGVATPGESGGQNR